MNARVLILITVVIVILMLVFSWLFFFRTIPETTPTNATGTFGIADTTSNVPLGTSSAGGTENQVVGTSQNGQLVFRVFEGPAAGATVIQTLRPTTTVARYVRADNGHVFDLVLDSPGAVPKAISNTTIPGVVRTLWAKEGQAVILQYLDGPTIKSVYLGFPEDAGTTTQAVNIKFLPDGIRDIAASPNGEQVVYLLRNGSGLTGYVANADGSGGEELFSVPLSEMLVSWPSQNTLLLQSKSAFGVPGVSFTVAVSNGNIVPLLYAPGLTLTADTTFSYIVYRTGGTAYVRETESGLGTILSLDPYPEKCSWSTATSSTLYCAAPLEYVPENYLDLWHVGSAAVTDGIVAYDLTTGLSKILTVPGGEDGGPASAIDSLALSPNDNYALFVRRGDRALWGVRLQSLQP